MADAGGRSTLVPARIAPVGMDQNVRVDGGQRRVGPQRRQVDFPFAERDLDAAAADGFRFATSRTTGVCPTSTQTTDRRDSIGRQPTLPSNSRGNGIVTGKRTFQKFFTQEDLRQWIEGVLGRPRRGGPGIFYVFPGRRRRTVVRRETGSLVNGGCQLSNGARISSPITRRRSSRSLRCHRAGTPPGGRRTLDDTATESALRHRPARAAAARSVAASVRRLSPRDGIRLRIWSPDLDSGEPEGWWHRVCIPYLWEVTVGARRQRHLVP